MTIPCSRVKLECSKLLFLCHRGLIKKTTQTAVINIVFLFELNVLPHENYFFLNFLAITGFRAIIANTAQKEAQLYL